MKALSLWRFYVLSLAWTIGSIAVVSAAVFEPRVHAAFESVMAVARAKVVVIVVAPDESAAATKEVE